MGDTIGQFLHRAIVTTSAGRGLLLNLDDAGNIQVVEAQMVSGEGADVSVLSKEMPPGVPEKLIRHSLENHKCYLGLYKGLGLFSHPFKCSCKSEMLHRPPYNFLAVICGPIWLSDGNRFVLYLDERLAKAFITNNYQSLASLVISYTPSCEAGNRDADFRRQAAEHAGTWLCSESVEGIKEALQDDDPVVREAALRALAGIGGRDIQSIVGGFFSLRPGETGEIVTPLIPLLSAAVAGRNPGEARLALEVFGSLGPIMESHSSIIIPRLCDGDAIIRKTAVEALGAIFETGSQPSQDTAHTHSDLRAAALKALERAIGDPDAAVAEQAHKALVQIAEDGTSSDRRIAVNAMPHITGALRRLITPDMLRTLLQKAMIVTGAERGFLIRLNEDGDPCIEMANIPEGAYDLPYKVNYIHTPMLSLPIVQECLQEQRPVLDLNTRGVSPWGQEWMTVYHVLCGPLYDKEGNALALYLDMRLEMTEGFSKDSLERMAQLVVNCLELKDEACSADPGRRLEVLEICAGWPGESTHALLKTLTEDPEGRIREKAFHFLEMKEKRQG